MMARLVFLAKSLQRPLRHPASCITLHPFLSPPKLHSIHAQYSVSSSNPHPNQAQEDSELPRFNAANIQMLSKSLHDQIFKSDSFEEVSQEVKQKIEKHLNEFGLYNKKTSVLPEVNFSLPELLGDNIDEHFRILAEQQTAVFRKQAEKLAQISKVPPRPKRWVYREGWTKYDPERRVQTAVDFPDEESLVFDIELLVEEGNFPTMATAVSPNAWYSWCSPRLTDSKRESFPTKGDRWGYEPEDITPNDLIPLEQPRADSTTKPKLVVGHNVGFDRAFVKEQYFMDGLRTRFLDTMSLHIAVSGLTSLQRVLYIAHKKGSRRKEIVEHEKLQRQFNRIPVNDWIEDSSLNSLDAVLKHYYPNQPSLKKESREIFIKGSMTDVRENFQELMHYCAADVVATVDVFKALWPLFLKRFPHPVTFAGMIEMGSTYLPVDSDWYRYVNAAEDKFNELQEEQKLTLMKVAEEACEYAKDDRYKKDVWLWDLDWSVKKPRAPPKKKKDGSFTPQKPVYLEGLPQWYRDLCPREKEVAEGHPSGPTKISTLMRVSPKLLRLVWDGFPVHYSEEHGWGYLVPKCPEEQERDFDLWEEDVDGGEEGEESPKPASKKKFVAPPTDFPIESLIDVVRHTKPAWLANLYKDSLPETESALNNVFYSTGEEESAEKRKHWESVGYGDEEGKVHFKDERFDDVIPGVIFYKLPHKDGKGKRVGNPLAKAFVNKLGEGCLRSLCGPKAEAVLHHSNVCSYWKMNMDRLRGQMVVPLKNDSPSKDKNSFQGVILPKVITAGTVTRRAVEATWLTASNAYADRIGSELKAMIRSPPGYHFVGADVDSQELWIASVLGDAFFAGVHGSTALGWMMLQGNKKDGTDMHSMTASLVGISRDQAKVFNYGRIYGAGVRFAKQLLMQFNHRLTEEEASSKARTMYAKTKGKKVRIRQSQHDHLDEYDDERQVQEPQWTGGSESHMFNQLEAIAQSCIPCTPVLGCTISKALEPRNVDTDFMASRINWVVQSSAVDYLHLMLVCMRWLIDTYQIEGRFSISIHDEVRYLVKSEDKYRAALALQITNLLTRAMFAHKLGMNDLPLSVAFFSAVDLDVCLRKEVNMDCVTPSNPDGLHKGYNIPPGEALGIHEILARTGGSLRAEDQMQHAEH